MSKLAQLRGQRDAKTKEAQAISDAHPDSRMPRAAADKVDALLYEIENIDRELDRHEKLNAGHAPTPGAESWSAGGTTLPVLRNAADIRAHYRAKSDADSEPIGLADFVRGVAGLKTTPEVKNALSVGTSTAGGFAVPSVVMGEILAALSPLSSLLTAGAGIVPLDEAAKSFTTAAISSVPTAAWRLEAGAVAQSDPVFRAVVATPQSLAFYFKISRELLADAPNIEAALRTAIATSFARELDRVGLRGTGTLPEPRGILNTSGIQSVTNGANGLSLTGYANFLSAYSAILGADAPKPTAAIMSPRSLVKLAGLLDTTNQPIEPPALLGGDGSTPGMLMLATSQIPNNLTVGSSTDCSEIYVADFRALSFMLREKMTVQLLLEQFSLTGELGFVAHMRADIALSYPAQFAVVTGVRA